jgi:Cu/Zn superoxide dismutase
MSTGGHFNPEKHIHGGPTTSPSTPHDLGNITADTSGKGMIDLTVDDITIGGDVTIRQGGDHSREEDDMKSQLAGAVERGFRVG